VSLINSAFRLSGVDPLAPADDGSRLIMDESITKSARDKRLKRLNRMAVRRRLGASR